MIATKLLRAEFFTIFGDQDTKSMQQGRGFDAEVFQQVCLEVPSILKMVGRRSLAGAERRH